MDKKNIQTNDKILIIPISNNEILQINENKKVYSEKPYSMCLAVTVLIVNIFFPGIGTIIGSYGINNPKFIFLSWYLWIVFNALYHSCLFLSVAPSGKSFDEF